MLKCLCGQCSAPDLAGELTTLPQIHSSRIPPPTPHHPRRLRRLDPRTFGLRCSPGGDPHCFLTNRTLISGSVVSATVMTRENIILLPQFFDAWNDAANSFSAGGAQTDTASVRPFSQFWRIVWSPLTILCTVPVSGLSSRSVVCYILITT